jgi:DNA-binding response OmpR family regulator
VDGHSDIREFLVILLGMAGYSVVSCDSIPQASQVVRGRQFDLYIVGDCLPHGSNLPLTAEIKANNPGAPLILYSALTFANDIDRGMRAGAHAYITKPGNLDCLLSTIDSLLNPGDPVRAARTAGNPLSWRQKSPASNRIDPAIASMKGPLLSHEWEVLRRG